MYKVFIENTPLHIIEKKDFIPNDVFVIYENDLSVFKESLFQVLTCLKGALPVYLVCESAELTFSKLFENFDFIEAAGGIVKRKKSYLFIKRNGLWDIPKGKIEKGESIEIAAVREIEEECGISNPKIDSMIGITYHSYHFRGRPTIKKTYWYSLNYDGSKKTKGQLEEGITKVKWFKESDIVGVKANTYASISEILDLYFILE